MRRRGDLAGDAVKVAVGVVAEEREAEPVLPAGRAVAGAGVAAGGHEDRHDVELEADGLARRGGGRERRCSDGDDDQRRRER